MPIVAGAGMDSDMRELAALREKARQDAARDAGMDSDMRVHSRRENRDAELASGMDSDTTELAALREKTRQDGEHRDRENHMNVNNFKALAREKVDNYEVAKTELEPSSPRTKQGNARQRTDMKQFDGDQAPPALDGEKTRAPGWAKVPALMGLFRSAQPSDLASFLPRIVRFNVAMRKPHSVAWAQRNSFVSTVISAVQHQKADPGAGGEADTGRLMRRLSERMGRRQTTTHAAFTQRSAMMWDKFERKTRFNAQAASITDGRAAAGDGAQGLGATSKDQREAGQDMVTPAGGSSSSSGGGGSSDSDSDSGSSRADSTDDSREKRPTQNHHLAAREKLGN